MIQVARTRSYYVRFVSPSSDLCGRRSTPSTACATSCITSALMSNVGGFTKMASDAMRATLARPSTAAIAAAGSVASCNTPRTPSTRRVELRCFAQRNARCTYVCASGATTTLYHRPRSAARAAVSSAVPACAVFEHSLASDLSPMAEAIVNRAGWWGAVISEINSGAIGVMRSIV